jgi:ABC-type multidrug transport system ATPase subunit
MRLETATVRNLLPVNHETIEFGHRTVEAPFNDMFGSLGVTIIAGPNGSGKTRLLSLLANVFHNAERFPERIRPAFTLTYRVRDKDGIARRCVLRGGNNARLSISVEDGIEGTIVPSSKKSATTSLSATLRYEDISQYLPQKVIVSAFSLHGEYPPPRPTNFIGDQRVRVFDVKNLYGQNHYGFPSFSDAIEKLINSSRSSAKGAMQLENVFGGKITGRVLTRPRDRYEYAGEDYFDEDGSAWTIYDSTIAKLHAEKEIYLNDFEILTDRGTSLCLGNMSSGQKMLVIRILSVLAEIENGCMVIIEEPEVHLDPAWCRQLISLLVAFFGDYDAHFLISTHSFSLINAVPRECLLFANEGRFTLPPSPTLLANESSIANVFYDPSPHYSEEFVRDVMKRSNRNDLVRLLAILGESAMRYDVFEQIQNMRDE